jgi:predicted peptidase
MPLALFVAFAVLLRVPVSADTGFLDRNITLAGQTYRYEIYVPAEYTRARSWPVIVDLHGNMLQGKDGLLPTRYALADAIRGHRESYPVIGVFPQAARGNYWEQLPMQQLVMAELDATEKEFHIDNAREYLTGFSMGAVGTYRIAYRWPERFAALVAIAGQVQALNAASAPDRTDIDRNTNAFTAATDPFSALAVRLKGLPISIYHGDADPLVSVEQSRQLVAALNKNGTAVRYTEFAATGHIDVSNKAYGDPELMKWLLEQRRQSR